MTGHDLAAEQRDRIWYRCLNCRQAWPFPPEPDDPCPGVIPCPTS